MMLINNIVAVVSTHLLSLSATTVAFVPLQYTNLQSNRLQRSSCIRHTSCKARNPFASSTQLMSSSPSSNDNDPNKKKELTPETIAEMIEVSFINSCLQLASGYVDVLKLFIVAVKAGYEAGLSLDQLEKLVHDCPVNTANRDLMKEEKDLRREWMLVVYTMLDGLNSIDGKVIASADANVEGTAESRVSNLISAILNIRQQLELEEEQSGGERDATAALASLSVSEALLRSETLTQMKDACGSNLMEKAFLMNDVSVAILTFKVIEEERLCLEGSSVNIQPPQPPIPGTS